MTTIASRESQRAAQSRHAAFERCLKEFAVPAGWRQIWWKSLLDRAAALILLIPGLPLIGLLVALIRMTSPGPGIYRQQRVGRGGRIFTMYKLRSMRIDAEAATGPVWAQAGRDGRVTALGLMLRRLHLDELPQLFNVLRGEMSLVGPRPERPEFVTVLAQQIPGYLHRLQVLPGITGLAQINLPPDTDLESVRRKLMLDCEYIERAGPLLDLRIILCTLLRLVGIRGGRGVRWLGLQRIVVLSDKSALAAGNGRAIPATPRSITAAKNDDESGAVGSAEDQFAAGTAVVSEN